VAVGSLVRRTASPARTALSIGLVRQAIHEGFDFLDAGDADRAVLGEQLIAQARTARGGPPEVATTLTGNDPMPRTSSSMSATVHGSSVSSPLGPDPSGWAEDLRQAVGRSIRRLGAGPIAVAWIEAGDVRSLAQPGVRATLEQDPRLVDWGVRYTGGVPDLGDVQQAIAGGARVFALEFHLLNARAAAPVVRAIVAAGGSIVVLDPHADGRLNGERLETPFAFAGATPGRPADWPTVLEELSPVTRLGFLTAGRQRTLAQAAIQYVLGAPGVSSVLVHPFDGKRLRGWRESIDRPPLTPAERDRIEGRGPGRPRADAPGT
jgi:aryl-alcohol dehydrogenase-like predicted oxidoreductase